MNHKEIEIFLKSFVTIAMSGPKEEHCFLTKKKLFFSLMIQDLEIKFGAPP